MVKVLPDAVCPYAKTDATVLRMLTVEPLQAMLNQRIPYLLKNSFVGSLLIKYFIYVNIYFGYHM